MIEYSNGSIFDADVEVLVNPVNCVGVMGAGLAKEFKVRYPLHHMEYVRACGIKFIKLGKVYPTLRANKMIIMFPTKHHWKHRSILQDVIEGCEDLVKVIQHYGIESIAIPAIGCGLGGLTWSRVLPVLVTKFEPLHNVRIIIYPPQESNDSIPS